MGKGISEILTYAVGVAISPVPIIAVTLMLFSWRARVNGLLFLLGWVVALAVISGVAYAAADQANAATDSTTSDAIAWGKIVFGVLFLLLAVRNWRTRPKGGAEPEMPKWMAGVDTLKPVKALGLGLLLAGVNPKNLMLAAGAGAGLAALGLSSTNAIGSLIVFVVIASVTIGGTGCLLSTRRRSREGPAGRDEELARPAQQRGHGSALPRVRRQTHRRRPATAHLDGSF